MGMLAALSRLTVALVALRMGRLATFLLLERTALMAEAESSSVAATLQSTYRLVALSP
jgi:hypothetical protein